MCLIMPQDMSLEMARAWGSKRDAAKRAAKLIKLRSLGMSAPITADPSPCAVDPLPPDGGGIIVGRVLDQDASASQIIDALANVPAVRFTAKTTTVEEAKTQFGEIVAVRRAEQLRKDNRIGKAPLIGRRSPFKANSPVKTKSSRFILSAMNPLLRKTLTAIGRSNDGPCLGK